MRNSSAKHRYHRSQEDIKLDISIWSLEKTHCTRESRDLGVRNKKPKSSQGLDQLQPRWSQSFVSPTRFSSFLGVRKKETPKLPALRWSSQNKYKAPMNPRSEFYLLVLGPEQRVGLQQKSETPDGADPQYCK